MPNYVRPRWQGATIFFTVALARRGEDVLCRHVEHLRAAVRETHADLPFESRAWVILPDHLHTIWTLPPGDGDYSTRWKRIKARFTKAVGITLPRTMSKANKGEAGLWQRRFWDHHIRDDADLTTHLRYCWWNPVKHGLVERAVDWPYSSLHRDIARGLAEPEWSGITGDGQFGE